MTKDDILNVENELYGAILNSDITKLDELLHADLLFIAPSGQVITKELDLQTYRDGALNVTELIPHVENIKIIDNLGVIALTLTLKGNYKGDVFSANYRYIRFWKMFDDGLKVVGGSGTQLVV